MSDCTFCNNDTVVAAVTVIDHDDADLAALLCRVCASALQEQGAAIDCVPRGEAGGD